MPLCFQSVRDERLAGGLDEFLVDDRCEQPVCSELGEGLRIPLLNEREAAELALHAIVVAMVVGILYDATRLRDLVVRLDPCDEVDRER